MANARITHIVDSVEQTRHEKFRSLMGIGYHAEVYSSVEELISFRPQAGVIMLDDAHSSESFEAQLHFLADQGIWLPVIATGIEPKAPQIVAAMKAGAFDYLVFPLDSDDDAERIRLILDEAAMQSDARRRLIEARDRLSKLSVREREVLDRLVEGNSNKAIARALEISPRTVEIHRAKMMDKLGARHPADAVRVSLEARM